MFIELRKLFSEKKIEKKEKRENIGAKKAAALLGGAVATGVSQGIAVNELMSSKHNKVLNSQNSKVVKDRLINEAKKQGTKIVEEPSFGNSAFLGSKSGKAYRKVTAAYAKRLRKKGVSNEDISKNINSISESVAGPNKKLWKNLGKDTIVMGNVDGTDILSHELGHSKYMVKGRSKMGLGKLSHKVYEASSLSTTTPVGAITSAINGYKSGVKAQKLKAEGKKESAWNKHRAWAVPVAMVAPMLVAEAAASKKGLNIMKSHGANKELLKASKKRLGSAWGTYAGLSASNAAIGEFSRQVGKSKERKRQEKNLKINSMYTVKRFSKASKEEKKLKELKPEGGLGLATLNLNRSSVRKGAARALKGYEEGKLNKGEAIKKAKKEGFKEGLKRSAVIGAVASAAGLASKAALAKGLTGASTKEVIKRLNKTAIAKRIASDAAYAGTVGGLISARGAKKRTEKTIDKSIKFK